MNNKNILEKYKGKVIGRTNRNVPIYVDELLDHNRLTHFLYNNYGPGDESLTKIGLEFLKEFFGLDKICDIIIKEKQDGVDYHFKSRQEIMDWFANFEVKLKKLNFE